MKTLHTSRPARWITVGLSALATLATLGAAPARADYLLAEQAYSSDGQRRGFQLYLDSSATRTGLRLKLRLGDGTNWRWLDFSSQPFSYGSAGSFYWVRAIVPPTGKSTLYLNDQRVTLANTSDKDTSTFVPYAANAPDPDVVQTGLDFYGRKNISKNDYVVRQRALQLTTGSNAPVSFTFPPLVTSPRLYAFAPHNPITATWKTLPNKTLVIQASFYLEPSLDMTNLNGPMVDAFGQSKDAGWSGKVTNLAGLQSQWSAEDSKYQAAPWLPSPDYDSYGGYKKSTWKPAGTNGFYRLAKNPSNSYWWLVTPDGNPCFYIGMDSVVQTFDRTLYTGRESLFPAIANPPGESSLPPTSHSAWGNSSDGKKTFGFLSYNLSRRYGSSYATQSRAYATTRRKAWGFSGFGKWSGGLGTSDPVQPVVKLPANVPHITGDLYDVWDSGVKSGLSSYISGSVASYKNDKNLLGWSFGNETDGIVWDKDIVAILQMSNIKTNGVHSVPAKHELVNYMRTVTLKSLSIVQIADRWGVALSDAAKNSAAHGDPMPAQAEIEKTAFGDNVPPADITSMRRYFARTYYDFVQKAFKAADPNHLYFGFWILVGAWQEEEDWNLIARYCDVIGYDYYDYNFDGSRVSRLIQGSQKPVLCGEYSFPMSYGGQRGFGVAGVNARDDADAGSLYEAWVRAAALNQFCVGTEWFELHDQPILGRGQAQDGSVPSLVLDENYAFGLVDITDRPKWDFINKVRPANLGAAPLRLGQPAPTPTPTPVAAATATPAPTPTPTATPKPKAVQASTPTAPSGNKS